MGRVAIVTGGTRGIGGAISIALKEAGYRVAANYLGNDEAAARFRDVTHIDIYKFDVGDFDACRAAVAQVEQEAGSDRRAGQQCRRNPGRHHAQRHTWSLSLFQLATNVPHSRFSTIRGHGNGRIWRLICLQAEQATTTKAGSVTTVANCSSGYRPLSTPAINAVALTELYLLVASCCNALNCHDMMPGRRRASHRRKHSRADELTPNHFSVNLSRPARGHQLSSRFS